MECQVILKNECAQMPAKAHQTDAGFDLYSCEDATVMPGARACIDTGIVFIAPTGYYTQIAPRSGMAYSHGIHVMAGIIDSGYRGNIKVILFNSGDMQLFLPAGSRIAQLIVHKLPDVVLSMSTCEFASDRGAAGFGSTGQ